MLVHSFNRNNSRMASLDRYRVTYDIAGGRMILHTPTEPGMQ